MKTEHILNVAIYPSREKSMRTQKPLDESESGEGTSWLKSQYSEN